MLGRWAFQLSQGRQALLVRALALVSCGALLLGFI